jgi:glycosyltransferase involved in cell wall biosynthesis
VKSISVIIPVFNSSASLEKCLSCLMVQTLPRDTFEIIVVDNGSGDDIRTVVDTFPGVVYAREEREGSYRARNAGIEIASGEVLAFTDADCLPRPDWLERGAAYFSEKNESVYVGGAILVRPQKSDSSSATEKYDLLFSFNQADNMERRKFAATANMFVSKDVARMIGGFASDLKSAGDLDFARKIMATNTRFVYAADAIVEHPSARHVGDLVRRHRRYVGGSFDLASQSRPLSLGGLVQELVSEMVVCARTCGAVLLRSGLPLDQKSRLVGVVCLVRGARMWEWIRLWSGGISRRE